MAKKITVADTLEMSPGERFRLAQDIWESVADNLDSLPPSDTERTEIKARLDAHLRNPNDAIPWSQVKKQILGEP